MSRLDQHIRSVRNKLTLGLFLDAWSAAALAGASVVLLYSIQRLLVGWRPVHEAVWLSGVVILSVVFGAWRAMRRRPDEITAAVAIDERLGLRETLSTALHARRMDDPFSQAALLNAEQTAGALDLRRKFPLHRPKTLVPFLVVALMAALLLGLWRPGSLWGSGPAVAAGADSQADARQHAKDNINRAIAAIDQAPKVINEKAPLQLSKAELQDLLKKPDLDPATANRKALAAMQQLQQATAEQKSDPAAAEIERTRQELTQMNPTDNDAGPIADAHRDLAQGDFKGAGQKLDDAVQRFERMSPAEQAKAAQQMQALADQLKKATADPYAEQRRQQQMQQLGMNAQQQRQAQDLLNKASQGDAKASQQLQQLAQQSVQQLNKGQPPTAQQRQQIQQLTQQMQAQASSQQQKQQLQQSTQKLADAMQQAAGVPAKQAPQIPDSNSKDSADQKSNAGMAQRSKPSAGDPQQARQASGDPSQADRQQQSQQMQKAMADAQDQLQKMQAQSQSAQQAAKAGQSAQQAAQAAQQQMNSGPAAGQQASAGNSNGSSDGSGGMNAGSSAPGAGTGHSNPFGASPGAPLQASIDKAVSPSDNTDPDHVLAGSLIKGDSPRGESHAPLQNVAKAAAQQAAEEVESERVNREGQKVVRDYFGSLGDSK
ncbi:MAG: hypothetical protein ACTHM6_13805 [Tepidisphaeraceae bacterium]